MDVSSVHRIWINRFQQYLKLYIETFLTVNMNPDLDEQIRANVTAGKFIKAYIIVTKYDESFRLTSKSKLFFTFRDLISPCHIETSKTKMIDQLGQIAKWIRVSSPEDIDLDFTSYLNAFYLPIIKSGHKQGSSKLPMFIGQYLHDTYGVPLVRFFLPLINLDPMSCVVCTTGRIPHVKIPGFACTPDVLVVNNEDTFYEDINESICNWNSNPLSNNNSLKLIIEIKTFHKIRVDKMQAFKIYNKITQNQDVKEDLLQLFKFLIHKQQITVDFKIEGKRKRNERFTKKCVLYPVKNYRHTSISHKQIAKFGFLRGVKAQKQYPINDICGNNTQGRLWIMFYNPHQAENVPVKYVLFDKSPFLFTPCSKVFYQMLEQRCVFQYHNPNATSLFIGMFSLQSDDSENSHICPSLVFVLEVIYTTFLIASMEETAVRLLCQYPEMFRDQGSEPMTSDEIEQFVKYLVWSKEEHNKRMIIEEEKPFELEIFE